MQRQRICITDFLNNIMSTDICIDCFFFGIYKEHQTSIPTHGQILHLSVGLVRYYPTLL